jgi:putative transposase
MVKRPEEWKWSSYACNGYGEDNPLIKPHSLYLAIHKDKATRVNYYREGFRQVLNTSLIDDLRAAVQTGTPLGNNKFKEEVEQLLGVKTGYLRRGRPKEVT